MQREAFSSDAQLSRPKGQPLPVHHEPQHSRLLQAFRSRVRLEQKGEVFSLFGCLYFLVAPFLVVPLKDEAFMPAVLLITSTVCFAAGGIGELLMYRVRQHKLRKRFPPDGSR